MITEEKIFDRLYSKYNKLFLTKKEVSEELSISQTTLNRRIKNMEALPSFKRDGNVYLFSIVSLAEYLLNTNGLNEFAF